MKVFGSISDARWINKKIEIVQEVKDADLVIFPGGADIDPSFYGEKAGKYTYASYTTDIRQFDIANQALKLGIPMLGICRGAQLLVSFAGGKLIQHVDNHIGGPHDILTNNSDLYTVNSLHHQMMFPFEMEQSKYKILAKASHARSKTYLNGEDEEINVGFFSKFCEPEIIWFPEVSGLAIQSHPEFMSMPHKTLLYMNELVNKYVIK